MENTNTVGTTNGAKLYEIVMEVKRITGEKDGKKYDFLAYSGYDNHNRKCKFKFTKACKGQPDEEGLFTVMIDSKMINKDKQSRFNDYWIKAVESFKKYDGFNKEELPFD